MGGVGEYKVILLSSRSYSDGVGGTSRPPAPAPTKRRRSSSQLARVPVTCSFSTIITIHTPTLSSLPSNGVQLMYHVRGAAAAAEPALVWVWLCVA